MARPALSIESLDNSNNYYIIPRTLPNKVLEITPGEKSSAKSFFELPTIQELKDPTAQVASYMRENFYFAADYLLNFNLFPFQAAMLNTMFAKRFIILLISRSGGKSLIMALYALLRAILFPPQEIVSISPTFRQTKGGVFKYIERVWANSPLLQELTDGDVLHYHDYYCLKFHNGSTIVGLPLGTGGSTRGQRSTCTICDERGVVPKDVLDVVIRPFTAAAADPMEKAIQLAEIDELLDQGYTKAEVAVRYKESFNQFIMAGSATYQFNSYYDDFVQYKNIIDSGGDKKKLMKALGGRLDEDYLQYIDPSDFCIVKVPWFKLPDGYPDTKDIMQAKVSMNSAQFSAEYECVTSDFYVHCVDSFKPIVLVKEGDLVITHDGSFRTVKRKYSREYSGPMILISTGSNSWTTVESFTVGHPIYTNNGMEKCEHVKVGSYLAYPIKRPAVVCDEYRGIKVDASFLRILAKFICCGHRNERYKRERISFSNLSFRSAHELKSDIKAVFGVKSVVKASGNESCQHVHVYDQAFLKFFEPLGDSVVDFKFPKELSNLPVNQTEIFLQAFIQNVTKEEDASGVKLTIQNIELGLLLADMFLRNEVLVRTYRRHGYTNNVRNKDGVLISTYVAPRVILRFVMPSDLIYIQNGFLYTKITGTDRRNENHRVFNLEVDGPEHSFCGPGIVAKNCFSYETKIITQDGIQQIGDCVDTEQRLLVGISKHGGYSSKGGWISSRIKSFGKQKLWKVTLKRENETKDIFVTEDHKWILHSRAGYWHKLYKKRNPDKELTTLELRKNDTLPYVFAQCLTNVTPSPFGIAHGFTFGDDHAHSNRRCSASADLCGEKDKDLLKYFSACIQKFDPNVCTGGKISVGPLPNYFKDYPSLKENTAYLYGWLAGYFAADGSVSKTGQVIISSAKKENLEFVQTLCTIIGIGYYNIRLSSDKNPFNGQYRELWSLSLMPTRLYEDFFILSHHKQRFLNASKLNAFFWKIVSVEPTNREEEVYCTTIDKYHNFALEGNIFTRQCSFPSDSDGFFKRTLIASAEQSIHPLLKGRQNKQYVLSLDPARARDRAAITLIELDFDGSGTGRNALVYCWSTKESEINEEIIPGEEEKFNDNAPRKKRYYKLLADKIRNLYKRFNVVRIVMDMDGGGTAVLDELKHPPEGEKPFWEIDDLSMIMYDVHRIVVMRKWNNDWVSAANHRTRANLEQKKLILPKFSLFSVEKLVGPDNTVGGDTFVAGDEFDRIIYEIEELKNEMASIVVTQTPSGVKERFGLPKKLASVGMGDSNSVADWKDRYSSLIMGDFEASEMLQLNIECQPIYCGGGIDELVNVYDNEPKDYGNRIHVDQGNNGSICYPG